MEIHTFRTPLSLLLALASLLHQVTSQAPTTTTTGTSPSSTILTATSPTSSPSSTTTTTLPSSNQTTTPTSTTPHQTSATLTTVPSHTDPAGGNPNPQGKNVDGGLATYYVAFLIIILFILLLSLFFFLRRRRLQRLRGGGGSSRTRALQRDLAGSGGRNEYFGRGGGSGGRMADGYFDRRYWYGRRGGAGSGEGLEQRVEGLNEEGEAPPPYVPKRRSEEERRRAAGGENDASGLGSSTSEVGPAFPMQSLTREGAALMKPPEYAEAVVREDRGSVASSSEARRGVAAERVERGGEDGEVV